MQSRVDFRYYEGESFGSANLIIHQGVTNVFHQTVQLLGILRVVEETREIFPVCC